MSLEMSNDEIRMTKEIRNPNDETKPLGLGTIAPVPTLSVVLDIRHSFVIGHSSFVIHLSP